MLERLHSSLQNQLLNAKYRGSVFSFAQQAGHRLIQHLIKILFRPLSLETTMTRTTWREKSCIRLSIVCRTLSASGDRFKFPALATMRCKYSPRRMTMMTRKLFNSLWNCWEIISFTCATTRYHAFTLYFVDSGAYTNESKQEYDHIKQDQLEWLQRTSASFEAKNNKPNALAFFHIPIWEYNDYESANPKLGSKREKVSSPSQGAAKVLETLKTSKEQFLLSDLKKHVGGTDPHFQWATSGQQAGKC